MQAVLSAISAVNWLSIGKNILTGVANGVKSMGSQMLKAFKGGFSSALNWLKSLPSQAVQWGKTLWQNFINGLTGKENLAKNLPRRPQQDLLWPKQPPAASLLR